MTPLEHLRLEKAAADCGFEMTPVEIDSELEMRSAHFPESVRVHVAGESRFEVTVSVADQPPIQPAIGLVEWEEPEMDVLRQDDRVIETDRQAIVLARRGQGLFKERVMRIERSCRITGVTRPEHLRASHAKPWRDVTHDERLDGENGLPLTPNADHLFDRGFIGFESNGDVLISPVADRESLARMGLDPNRSINVGRFGDGQKRYLEFHRENVLLKSRFLEENRR